MLAYGDLLDVVYYRSGISGSPRGLGSCADRCGEPGFAVASRRTVHDNGPIYTADAHVDPM